MKFTIHSSSHRQAIDITPDLNKLLATKSLLTGSALVFVKHTTAALAVSEVGEGTEEDLLEVVEKLLPPINYRHIHDPAHAPDHMLGSIIGPAVTIPIWEGKLDLGTWQRVVLLEFNGPRQLQLVISYSK